MNKSQNYIDNVSNLGDFGQLPGNAPAQYASRGYQYMGNRTRLFAANRAYLATDYVQAEVQGLTDSFYEYITTNIRLNDVSTSNVTAFDNKKIDDFKRVLFPDIAINYIPSGAKINTMGSTWIVINPMSLSISGAQAVIARCNATYNVYDAFGNIIQEPIVVQRYSMLSNRNESPKNLTLMAGYFNIICQYNAVTATLNENSRLILGKKSYMITGFTDFLEEFTGEFDSSYLISFTARVEEPTETDDLSNRIVNGLTSSFTVNLLGNSQLSVGQTSQLEPIYTPSGAYIVESVPELPQWEYASSNEDIATVSTSGLVEAISEGAAEIKAILKQNPSLTATLNINVTNTLPVAYTAFTCVVPRAIAQYQSATISAAYYENGQETDNAVSWSFSGADPDSYNTTLSENGKSVTITCIAPSDIELTITAAYNESSVTDSVILEGY